MSLDIQKSYRSDYAMPEAVTKGGGFKKRVGKRATKDPTDLVSFLDELNDDSQTQLKSKSDLHKQLQSQTLDDLDDKLAKARSFQRAFQKASKPALNVDEEDDFQNQLDKVRKAKQKQEFDVLEQINQNADEGEVNPQ